MYKSGELAKYPLAIVAKVLKVISEETCSGYDIGCNLYTIISNSSLSSKFKDLGSRLVMDAFHGYSHNYVCQAHYHPNVIKGVGLEDFAGMERIFSASNSVAPVTRYASGWHRCIFINMFFKQWDDDKYLSSGTMMLNNYCQALKILLDQWEYEERTYVKTLTQDYPYDVHKVAYVKALRELRNAQKHYEVTNEQFLNLSPAYYDTLQNSEMMNDEQYKYEWELTNNNEIAREVAMENFDTWMLQVTELEIKLGIRRRWTPADLEYQYTAKFTDLKEYHDSLDHLQRLVILRLFELQKLNLAQTGYKMRTHIAKALQNHSKAIRNAVKKYNAAAAAIGRPTVDWEKVSHYSFLEDFTLLHNTREDVTIRPWARPDHRVILQQYRRLKRAKEEIKRLNVEVRRLHTAIIDERANMAVVLDRLKVEQSPLLPIVQQHWDRQSHTNARLLACVQQIYTLEGYSGTQGPGKHVGRTINSSTIPSPPQPQDLALEQSALLLDDEECLEAEDDEQSQATTNIMEFISETSTL